MIFLVRRKNEDKIELGYRLLTEYWKNGYCKESAQALISKVFDESSEKKIHAETHPENINSIHFLLKFGFKEVYHEFKDRGRIFILEKSDYELKN